MHIDIRGYWTRTSAIISSSSSPCESSTTSVIKPSHTSSSVVTPSSTPCTTSTIVTPTSTPCTTESSIVGPTKPTSSSSLRSSSSKTSSTPLISTTEMPSITGTITSAVTIFVTLTSAAPQTYGDIPSAIRGLSPCAQGVLFPLLAGAQCNPADFPCICIELDRLGAGAAVASKCTYTEVAQYQAFQSNSCGSGRQVSVTSIVSDSSTAGSTSAVSSTSSASPASSISSTTPITLVTPTMPISTGTGLPFPIPVNGTNGTIPTNGTTGPVVPVSLTTATVVVPTTDVNGQPTDVTSVIVSPAGPTTANSPSGPEYTAGAAAFQVPEFGSGRMGIAAGVIGLMGLVFAEL